MNSCCEEKGGKFVRHSLALELCCSLTGDPVSLGEVSQVDVNRLRYERAGGYSAVTGGETPVFGVAFVQDDCVGSVEFDNTSHFDTVEDCVDNELEVFYCSGTTIKIVSSSDRVEVGHIGSYFLEQILCLRFRQFWDFRGFFADFNDVPMVFSKPLKICSAVGTSLC